MKSCPCVCLQELEASKRTIHTLEGEVGTLRQRYESLVHAAENLRMSLEGSRVGSHGVAGELSRGLGESRQELEGDLRRYTSDLGGIWPSTPYGVRLSHLALCSVMHVRLCHVTSRGHVICSKMVKAQSGRTSATRVRNVQFLCVRRPGCRH